MGPGQQMELDEDFVTRFTAEKWPLVRREIERVLPRTGPFSRWLNEPAWYHIGDDCIDPVTKRGPKRSRPMLCLMAAECLGVPLRDALPFAAATEITHSYLICHDDLMDGDTSRRDRPAVWVRYGEAGEKRRGEYLRRVMRGLRPGDRGIANGINLGDYMMAKAYEVITTSHLPVEKKLALCEVLTLTLVKTGEGQALDINLRADAGFTVEKYRELATLKTGYYLIFGVVGAAILAGLGERAVSDLWRLGGNVGVAFQILDDVIDLTTGKGRMGRDGKPEIGNDIREGKPSALFARALEVCGPREREELLAIFKKPRERTTKRDIERVISIYRKNGVVDWEPGGRTRRVRGWAVDEAERLLREALAIVDGMEGLGNSEQAERFRALMRFMARRES
ncbi:MAG: polyprenyl synthetase family protein [Thermoplasmata archaeon]